MVLVQFPHLKSMFPLSCNFQLWETEKYKLGMLQWPIFNTNIIEIFNKLTS